MHLTTDQLAAVTAGLRLPLLRRAVEHYGDLFEVMQGWRQEIDWLRRFRVDDDQLAHLVGEERKLSRSADRFQKWIVRRTR